MAIRLVLSDRVTYKPGFLMPGHIYLSLYVTLYLIYANKSESSVSRQLSDGMNYRTNFYAL